MTNQLRYRKGRPLSSIVLLLALFTFIFFQGALPFPEPAFAQAARESDFPHAMHQSMAEMRRDMAAAPMTGDPDRDFAEMMIPHHQGAVNMARAELMYGNNPVLRRLAQEIIVDQQSEIEVMKLWLKNHPPKAGSGGPKK